MEVCEGPACFLASMSATPPQLLCGPRYVAEAWIHRHHRQVSKQIWPSALHIVWSLLLQCLLWLALLLLSVLEHLCCGLFFYTSTKGIKSKYFKEEKLNLDDEMVLACEYCVWWVQGTHGLSKLGCVPKSKHLPHSSDPRDRKMQNLMQMETRNRQICPQTMSNTSAINKE